MAPSRAILALPLAFLAAMAFLVLPAPSRADEGMWTLDNLPRRLLQERYGFAPTPEWIEHIQKASVNFGGGSGAFVSPDGLVLTNHHVALGQLAKLSSREHNYVRDGFYARTPAEEVACPDLELKVLFLTEDVTARVLSALTLGASDREQAQERKAIRAVIEQEAAARTGLKCEVVELYRGGEYWLYGYRTYKDVRLVCAPEQQIAFFGGDSDNFSYPRHDLDFAFFRVYENGQPLRPEHWLRWSAGGPRDGDLVFVSGHPGTTHRRSTVAQLEVERDLALPLRLRLNLERLAAYRAYEARGAEPARQARDRVFGLENNIKRQRGYLEVLSDPSVMAKLRGEEDALRARVTADAVLGVEAVASWDRISVAMKEMRRRHREYVVRDLSRVSRLLDIANGIVRYTAETAKPNETRFEEYRDTNLESQRFRLFSPAPLYPEMEAMILAVALKQARDELGPDDAFVMAALGGKSPEEVANAVVAGTKLADPALRRELVEGGVPAVLALSDPLLVWARAVDGPYRELRAWYEEKVQSVESREGGKIARARFALDGHATYPDATGTLRLSFGRVAGYEQLTSLVPWKTTFHGLFDRADSFDGQPPFDLPPRVVAARGDIDLDTPLDFVCTTDIIGGNSGSPVVNRAGELVGLVFDGNIQAFAWDYVFTDTQARCVAVHSAAVIEALRHIYDMGVLAEELAGTRAR